MFDFNFFSQANRLHEIWPHLRGQKKFDVLDRQGSHELLYYKSEEKKFASPIFIIPSMISHYYILDLQEDKSLIRYLNDTGYDVYVLNWGLPVNEDQFLNFTSLLKNRIPYFAEQVREHSKANKIHLMGHCLGGTIAAMYASLHPEHLTSLFLLTSPLDFSIESRLTDWVNKGTVDYKLLTESFGNIPWPILHSSFLMLKPLSQYSRLKKYFQQKMSFEQKKNYWALELWSHDSVAFRGGCYMNLIQGLYIQNSFYENNFKLDDSKTVKICDIKIPTLMIASNEDHIVPLKSAFIDKNKIKSNDVTQIQYSGGHVSCLVHKKTQLELWPQITNWIGRQNGQH